MKAPLVHCITNAVTAPFVADCVAAVGGRPIMAEDPADCAELARVADGLFINLGQLTEGKRDAILASLERRGDRPWVLDPVGVGFFPERLTFARELMGFRPTCVRGNASEIWALATGGASGSGTDSTLNGEQDWINLTQNLNAPEICLTQASRMTGQRDLSLHGGKARWFAGGRATMGLLSGFGCALSAVVATIGSGAAALDLFSQAGQATQTTHLGDFRQEFLTHLARLARRARVLPMLPLYFVAGPQDCDDLPSVLQGALVGGITCFQYRPKNQSWDQTLKLGEALRHQCAKAGVPFIANDSIELAQALGADGVHLGQGDGDPAEARRTLGDQALIGLSVSTPDQWSKYDAGLIDYVGLGPFATTQTKLDARAPLGVDGLRALRQGFEMVPSVVIGGLGRENSAQALQGGVDGLAVVSAISKSSDPRSASEQLKRIPSRLDQPTQGTSALTKALKPFE